MPERDGYIPGVPCWVDTSQPDPTGRRRLLRRPVRLGVRGRDAAGVARAGTSSRDSAAATWPPIGSQPEGGAADRRRGTPTSGSRAPTRPPRRCAPPAAASLMEPFDVMDAGRMAVFTDPEGAAFCVWQAKRAQGRADRQRARLAELQRPEHPRRRGREVVLRRGVRLGDARPAAAPRCGRCPATATTSSESDPGLRERMARDGRPEGFEDVVAAINPIADDQPDAPAHWSVTFAVDDADATAAKAAELGGRVVVAAVRRSLGPDDRHRRPAGRDVHRQQVRPREPGPRQPVQRDGWGRVAISERNSRRRLHGAKAGVGAVRFRPWCAPCAAGPSAISRRPVRRA